MPLRVHVKSACQLKYSATPAPGSSVASVAASASRFSAVASIGVLRIRGRRTDPGEVVRHGAILPARHEFAAAFALDRREREVDCGGYQDAAGLQETLPRIGEHGKNAVVEAEVADVIANDNVGALS